jgi:hypothetical protein
MVTRNQSNNQPRAVATHGPGSYPHPSTGQSNRSRDPTLTYTQHSTRLSTRSSAARPSTDFPLLLLLLQLPTLSPLPTSPSLHASSVLTTTFSLYPRVVLCCTAKPTFSPSRPGRPPPDFTISLPLALQPTLALPNLASKPTQILVAAPSALLRLRSPATAFYPHQHPSPKFSQSRNPGRDSRLAD